MCYVSIPSVEVGQVITCAADNLMKSTYFYANPTFGFFPELYEGEHQFGETTMYISRGMGNSVAPVRINNSPEIVVLDTY